VSHKRGRSYLENPTFIGGKRGETALRGRKTLKKKENIEGGDIGKRKGRKDVEWPNIQSIEVAPGKDPIRIFPREGLP